MIKQQYLLQQIVPSVFIKCEIIFNSSSKWVFLIPFVVILECRPLLLLWP